MHWLCNVNPSRLTNRYAEGQVLALRVGRAWQHSGMVCMKVYPSDGNPYPTDVLTTYSGRGGTKINCRPALFL